MMRPRLVSVSLPASLVLLLAATGCPSDDAVAQDESSSTGEDSSSGSVSLDPTAATMTTMMSGTADSSSDDSSSTLDPDSSGTSATGDTSSTTEAPNTAPQADDDILYTRQDVPLVVRAAGLLDNDVDDDGDALVVSAFDAQSSGGGTVVVGDDGAVDYTPAAGWFGADSFEYTVSDGTDEATATVTVYVAPVLVPLGTVAGGVGGFAIDGELDNDRAGSPVGAGGDVDGDGLDDILVGAPEADHVIMNAGRGYVVLGKTDTDNVLLTDLVEGNGGFIIDPAVISADTARSISDAGDINGDGLADVLIGAPQESVAYVVFGRAGDTTPVSLTDVESGNGGFTLVSEGNTDFTGRRVKPAGDVNGDGVPDLLVGAPLRDVNGADGGRTYVVFGAVDAMAPIDLSDVADGEGGFVIDGESAFDYAGFGLGGAQDINGDGLADIVVGAYGANVGVQAAGRAYVVFGKDRDTDPVPLSDVAEGIGGFVIDGELASDACGFSVASPGDVDGDGLGDVLVGAPNNDVSGSSSGRSYVVFGRAETEPVALLDVAMGTGGFAIDGEDFGDASGGAVSAAGDVNGDGLADLLVGAPFAGYAGADSGRTYLVYGKAGGDAVLLEEVATGTGGFALDGELPDDISGVSVDGGFDVNGDGFADIVVGAAGVDLAGTDFGRSYVVFGVPTEPTE